MPLTFLLDEQLRGVLLRAIRHHNARGGLFIDAVQVGDPPDLPRQSTDPDILLWAERQNRIIVTRDVRTMPGHFRNHLLAGHHSPGLLLLARRMRLSIIVDFLEVIAHAGEPSDILDQIVPIP
jgi:predicted nuclease of predicted toxin-antitoxin system